jgi:hypothetical protein
MTERMLLGMFTVDCGDTHCWPCRNANHKKSTPTDHWTPWCARLGTTLTADADGKHLRHEDCLKSEKLVDLDVDRLIERIEELEERVSELEVDR